MKSIKNVLEIIIIVILSLWYAFSEHNIIRLVGGTARYCIDQIFNTEEKGKPLKSYWSYKKKEGPQTEFLDAILGGFVIGILALISVALINRFS
jgi:hypothetical protein